MKRRYLITGGAGFIGSNFVHYLYHNENEDEFEVNVLDKLTYSSSLENLSHYMGKKNFNFIQGDICDPDTVRDAMEGANIVVNFAAEVAVDRSIDDPTSFLNTDIFGVYTLLNEAKYLGNIDKFIQISTDEVYGHIMEGSFDEVSELKPRNPYAASKLGGERLAFSFYETYGIPVIVTRGSNTYGPQAHLEKVIPLFITNLIDGEQVPVFGDGTQIRDWLYVEDHCAAIYHLLDHGKNGETYNIGGGQEYANIELTRLIIHELDKDESVIKYVADRPGHDLRYSINSKKMHNLGWKPSNDLKLGLKKTINWYTKNESWWREIKSNMDKKHFSGYWGNKNNE